MFAYARVIHISSIHALKVPEYLPTFTNIYAFAKVVEYLKTFSHRSLGDGPTAENSPDFALSGRIWITEKYLF